MTLPRRLLAEALGTAFLLATVVGSGVMGERLSAGNDALALLANALATGAGLFALVMLFAGVSGAHFNPVVTLVATLRRELRVREAPAYVAAQLGGAVAGTMAAHAMFGLPLLMASRHARAGLPQLWSEGIATFGLVLVVVGVARRGVPAVAASVACYITAAYWFTASTSFANPAVTVARAFTDTFSGIRPVDVPGFVVAQVVAAMCATWIGGVLFAPESERPIALHT